MRTGIFHAGIVALRASGMEPGSDVSRIGCDLQWRVQSRKIEAVEDLSIGVVSAVKDLLKCSVNYAIFHFFI